MPTAEELLGVKAEAAEPRQTAEEMLTGQKPLTTAQKIVRGSVGSTVGGALGGTAGGIIGSAVPVVGTAAGAVGGTMIGSAAGEAVMQYVDPIREWAGGGEEGSAAQVAIAGLMPLVPTVARRFFLSLPGAASGLQQFLFRTLGDKGERLVSKVAPVAGTADELFKQSREISRGLRVPMPATTATAKNIANEVSKSKFVTGSGKVLAARAQQFAQQGVVDFDTFRLNMSDVGALVRSLERKGGAALGRAKQLYAAMWDDLDNALLTSGPLPAAPKGPMKALPPIGGTSPTSYGPTGRFVAAELTGREGVERTLEAASAAARGELFRGTENVISRAPAGPSIIGQTMRAAEEPATVLYEMGRSPGQQALAQAIDAFKREEAAKFIKGWWIGSTLRRAGQQNIDIDSFVTKIDRGREALEKLLPAGEIDDLIKTLTTKPVAPGGVVAAQVPTMAKTPRLGFEAMPFSQRAVVGAAVGAIGGQVVGGPAGFLGGGAAGVLAVEALSHALSTGPGRALVRTLAERGVGWNQIGNLLLQGGRRALSAEAQARVNAPREPEP